MMKFKDMTRDTQSGLVFVSLSVLQTVKPSGSVSLLSRATPGVHWPSGGKYYLRAIRFANSDPMPTLFKMAWYKVEPDQYSDNTSVVLLPGKDRYGCEKTYLYMRRFTCCRLLRTTGLDNSVSVTVISIQKQKRTTLLVYSQDA